MRPTARLSLTVACALAACSGGTGKTPDARGIVDAGPISAPDMTWTWVPLRGTTCGDGSTAGIGVNLASQSSDLLVYLEGGGACWDANTCFVLNTAAQIAAPYTTAQFDVDVANLDASGLFSRTDAASRFAAASFVYVPYCTGDVHAGTVVRAYTVNGQTKTVHHTGGLNAQVIVDAVHATLPGVTRIWLTGSSAGGYGATLNVPRFAAAWPSASVELLQDSAPFVDVMGGVYPVMQQAWALAFPPGCAACASGFPAVIDALTTGYPAVRIGLLTYTEDAVVKAYFGYSGSMMPALEALLANQYGHPTTQAFVLAGTSHTMLGSYRTIVAPDGTTLESWVQAWATGDPAWHTVQ
jgi:hypothetical protein